MEVKANYTPPVEPLLNNITVTLTPNEAIILQSLVEHITGNGSVKNFTDKLWGDLYKINKNIDTKYDIYFGEQTLFVIGNV